MVKIGVIGGSGLYGMEGLEILEELEVSTPFGAPSGPLALGRLDGVEVVFVPRHGPGHVHLPTDVNYAANIWALKSIGVEWIISVSAVGSLREEIKPGSVVLIDQFIDRTHHRVHTFFGEGFVGHVSVADPVCETLRGYLKQATQKHTKDFHDGGTYVNMEGPAFSTKAESNLYRSWNAQVVGMTCLPEARLAREAEISYAVLAMATDYDCWHDSHGNVSVSEVVATLKANVKLSQDIVRSAVKLVAGHKGEHPQKGAMEGACMTQKDHIPKRTLRALGPIVEKYFEIPSEEECIAEEKAHGGCCGNKCHGKACAFTGYVVAGLVGAVAFAGIQALLALRK